MSPSAVLVHVPEAEPVVGEWRRRHTYDGSLGMPPHVTLLFPFVPADELGAEVEERLMRLLGEVEPFDVTFSRTASFPSVLYLEPEPFDPFAALTGGIAAEWPDHPPYEGAHETVIPHLTVAQGDDHGLLERIAADIETQLPIETRVREAQLYVEDPAGRWRKRRLFPLAE